MKSHLLYLQICWGFYYIITKLVLEEIYLLEGYVRTYEERRVDLFLGMPSKDQKRGTRNILWQLEFWEGLTFFSPALHSIANKGFPIGHDFTHE